MRTLQSALPLRVGALLAMALSTACFTPADFGAGVAAEEHGDAAHPEGEHPEAEGEREVIVEGIIPGTEPSKVSIKLPEIAYEAPYDGKPLSSKTLPSGVVVEEFVLGDAAGPASGDDMLIEFEFKGYATASGQPVMGSRGAPSKLVINETTRTKEPIARSIAEGMDGMKVGGKRRIKIPAEIVEENAPPGRPSIGDLIITVELVNATPAPKLEGPEAYAGEPIDTQKRSNGLEIYDYVAGEGPAAKAGDQVVTHYIGQLLDGTEFDSSHDRPEGLPLVVGGPGVIPGFSQGVEGAKVGMLRKVVIPPELGYGDQDRGKIPPNSTLVFYLQITSVTPGSGAQQDVIIPRNPEQPAKPAKPAKPAEGGGE